MVVGLLGNKSTYSNRFILVFPKPENGVRLQATLGSKNPTGLPMGVVSWMGDYASDTEQYKEKFEKDDLYSLVWNDNDDEEQGLKSNQLKLNNKYLVNHTSKEYINCKQYKKENMKEEWCLHPLPLMTAVGNGMGGGDYYGPDKDVVGVWAGDLISVEDTAPDGYTLVCVNFVE